MTAGEGVRLRPYTTARPKGMIPVANKPILEHLVEALVKVGIKQIIMVVGYHKESVMSHFGDGQEWKASIEYARQQKPLGTGNALMAAREQLGDSDSFLVLPGDNYLSPGDLQRLLDEPKPAILVTESSEPAKYGVVKIERGKVTGIYEKELGRGPALISTGTYHLDSNALRVLSRAARHGNHILSEVLGRGVGAGELEFSTATADSWRDAVYPWDLLGLNDLALRDMKEGQAGKLEPNVVIKGPVSIGPGTVVRAGCYLEGPLVIGEGCDIGPHCVIRPATSIGDNVILGSHSHLAHSLIMPDCQLGAFDHLASSVVGQGCSLGTHTAASSGPATIQYRGQLHSVATVGALIGDDCQLGDHVTLSRGTTLYAMVQVGDLNLIRHSIREGMEIL